jgi:membrane-bound lytic murein transglycosylase D
MTCSRKRIFLTSVFVSVCTTTGCVSTGSQRFGLSFLPPAARPTIYTPAPHEAPSVRANPYVTESQLFVKPNLQIPPRPSQVDVRIRRSDERFSEGKRLFEQGDVVGARIEFDAAIDTLLGTPEHLPDRHKVELKLEQLILAIHKYDVNRLGAGDLSAGPTWDKAPLEDILDLTFPIDPNLKPRVSEQLNATASQLPLEINDAVLSYINYFSSEKGRRTLLAGLRRAGRYKPLISRILAEEGVPQELIYLAQAESGFLPRAVSHKAAVGMWQFIQSRGREYGLTQTAHTDDRLDPEKATRSAARHLRDLYTKFGDWYLAIAGYNCGDGCVERAVQRTGYADFWKVRSLNAIPRETTNYVPIILAMTIMHKNARDYGLEEIEIDPPLVYDNVEIEAPTHLALIADAADRPVSEIRELNPALLSNIAPAGLVVHVPEGTKPQVLAALEAIPADRRASWRIHRVSDGDTIESIARRYGMPTGAIAAANNSADAEVGDVLIIPTATQLEKAARKPAQTRRTVSVSHSKSSRTSAKTTTATSKKTVSTVQRRGVHTAGLR